MTEKTRRGRPRKNPRSLQTSFRISEPERAEWEKAADELGLSVSSWVRMACKRQVDRQKRGGD